MRHGPAEVAAVDEVRGREHVQPGERLARRPRPGLDHRSQARGDPQGALHHGVLDVAGAQIGQGHVAALESTDDDAAWLVAGMHHIVITTVGRKSGTEHKVALPFWRDPEGTRVVVASYAGAPQHPSLARILNVAFESCWLQGMTFDEARAHVLREQRKTA